MLVSGGRGVFYLFKESLIAFILYRIWRWTAAPGRTGGLSLPHGPVPAPSTIYIYMRKSATASHHFSSSQSISLRLPLPSPTHEQFIKCAAFCGVHPSQTHHCSSYFPISHSHCLFGPLSVIMYTSPFTVLRAPGEKFRYARGPGPPRAHTIRGWPGPPGRLRNSRAPREYGKNRNKRVSMPLQSK